MADDQADVPDGADVPDDNDTGDTGDTGSKGGEVKPKGGSGSSKGGKNGSKPSVDDALKAAEEAEQKKLQDNASKASFAEAKNFIDKALPEFEDDLSDKVKTVIGCYRGDKNDYPAREMWVKEAVVKDFFSSMDEAELKAQPKLQQKLIAGIKKEGDGYGADELEKLNTLYDIMQEVKDNRKDQAEAQAILDTKDKHKGMLSEADLAKLKPQQRVERQSQYAGQAARSARQAQRDAAMQGGSK